MPSLTRVSQYQQSRLKAPLRIVSIGGGTGLSTLLSGVKKFATGSLRLAESGKPLVDIVAVVTVSDDGGSSGRLRRDFDILPPGDIRNCMTALSEDEALLSQLFRYRFASGHGLKGHSFGNLFLTAMHQITGDFAQAVKLSSEILAIRGHIYPATAANVTLEAVLADDTVVRGESTISKSRKAIRKIRLHPANCKPLSDVLTALENADLITLGPGSLYTSVVPNILVKGMAEAIEKSAAMKVYFVNLMWQPGETINFTASQHVKVILAHAKRHVIDCVVLNSAPIAPALQKRYERDKVKPVENDIEALDKLGVKIVTADLVAESAVAQGRIRHDPAALAEVVIDLASRSRAFQVRKEALAAKAVQLK
jgi:uncharacterized cofD-like protein